MAMSSYPSEQQSPPPDLTGDEKVLWEARERFRQCCDYSSDIRAEMLDDIRFFKGDQWNSLIMKERTDDRRPALTVNKLPTYVSQVVNSLRRSRPSIKIRPVDSVTDIKTADVINGLIRHIMSNNDVKSAMDTALEYAVMCGQGYLRLRTDYCNENSFDQEVIIDRIENPLSVYFPFNLCKRADLSDAPYCFIRTSMSKDEFKRQYGEKAMDEVESWTSKSIGDSNWTEENMVWLAEYYTVDEKEETLYLLSNGVKTMDKDEVDQWETQGVTVIKERKTTTRKITWRLMSEQTILEEEEFPSKYIPVIPCFGWEICLDGKKYYQSLIRHAKDPQRFYNYLKSMEAETLALAPRTTWLIAEGQAEGYENDWKVANLKNLAYLTYRPVTFQGQPVPPPSRIEPPNIPTAAVNAMREASDDIKSVTGIFDASLGAQGNEQSGRAIIARQQQGDNATYHFSDNLVRAVHLMGKILVDLLPKVYDTPRAVRILGEDMAESVIVVNQMYYDENRGENVLYDVTAGEYDVIVDVSPDYASRRIETAENLTNIIQAIPTIGQFSSDILVRNLDFPQSQELADRLKRTIPPQILEDPNKNPNKVSEADIRSMVADLQALQQQLQMSEAQKGQLLQTLQHYQNLLKSKESALNVQASVAALRADTELQKAQLGLETEKIKQHHDLTKHAVDAAIDLHKNSQASQAVEMPVFNRSQQQSPATALAEQIGV